MLDAGTMRRQVQHDHQGHARIVRQLLEQLQGRGHPAGGGADTDHRVLQGGAPHFDPSSQSMLFLAACLFMQSPMLWPVHGIDLCVR